MTLAALLLAGCAGPASLYGPPSVQSAAAAQHRGAIAEAAGPADWDLLYVSNASGTVTVYRYWQQQLIATLSGFQNPEGECVGKGGAVYITDAGLRAIVEYHHGAKTPERTIPDTGYQPASCSVDPANGNLAVVNPTTASGSVGNVAVYPGGSGKANLYDPKLDGYGPLTCGYDSSGNLLIATEYAAGSYEDARFAWMPKGAKAFKPIALAQIGKSKFQFVTNVQWDGEYWAVTDNGNILRFSISASGKATYASTTTVSGNWDNTTQVWITNFTGEASQQGNQMVAAEAATVLYWKYPAGGDAFESVSDGIYMPYGVTISLKTAKP